MRRILSALVLIPVVLYPILFGPLYLLVALVLLCTALGLWEVFRLARAMFVPHASGPASRSHIAEIVGYPVGLLTALALSVGELSVSDARLLAVVLVSSISLAAIMASAFTLDSRIPSAAKHLFAFIAVLYVAVPLGLLAWIWNQRDGTFYLVFTLIIIWAGDTAGYYIGKNFGKHKSSPRISPKKTWEGTIASFLAALLVGAITAFYFWGGEHPAELIVLTGFLNIAGQVGDLAESGLKRRAGVKDSSNLIPGHGGVLDRIDALLFAAPVLYYYWLWQAS